MLSHIFYGSIAIAGAILIGIIALVSLLWPLLLALLFGAGAIYFYQDAQRLPSAPQPISLADPAALAQLPPGQEHWVVLEDGILDCPNLHTFGGSKAAYNTDLLITNENRTVVMVAHIDGHHTCQEIAQTPITGLLSRELDRNAIQHTGSFGLDQFDLSAYPNATVYLDLCTYCGRGNDQLGVIVCGTLAVAALSLYPLVWWSNRRYGSSVQF